MKFSLPIVGEVRLGKDIPSAPKEKLTTDLLGGFVDFSGSKLSNEKSVSKKLLEANRGWVYRNNDAIAQEVSKINFKLYTVGLSKGEIVFNEIDSHPLLDLLDKPNPEMTKSEMIYILQSHKKLAGDAFLVKIRNGRQIKALRGLAPDKVVLDLQSPTDTDPTAIRAYSYKDTVNGEQVTAVYQPEDIMMFKKPNPANPFRGLGAVEAMAETIDLDNLTTEVMINYLRNGAIQNFALTTKAKLLPEQLDRMKSEMRAAMQGTKNAFNVPVFGGGMTPVDISYSNKEQQVMDQLDWYKEKIMFGFGNTKASLGMVDDVNRASFEGSIIGWLRNTVKPDMEAIVSTLNEYLVPEFGDNLILGFDDPVPEDRADDVLEATELFKAGLIRRSEARELVNYDSEDSDEVYFIPLQGTLEPDTLNPEEPDEES